MNPLSHGLCALFCLFTSATSIAEETKGLDLKLVSEVGKITPAKPFTVGLHLHHHEHFHSYWKNPGIVGVPTSLTWKLPEGFQASEIQWPAPEHCLMVGHPCHGYERDVTLLVTITPPAVLPEGKITLSAEAQWMACAQTCHPGFQNVSITFPRDLENGPQLIKKAKTEIPQPDAKLELTLKGTPDAREVTLLIPVQPQEKVYFFSTDGQISSDQPQVIASHKRDPILLRMTRSEFSPENKKSLPGVLQIGKRFIAVDPPYPE